jgi:SPP1 family predicted phage head-tail adaptor
MNPGSLRNRVTIEAKGGTVDGLGGRDVVWTGVATVWANVEPLEGSEATRAMQQGIRQPHRIRMRWRDGVRTSQRLTMDDRVFNIRSVVDVDLRHRELEIVAEEVTP